MIVRNLLVKLSFSGSASKLLSFNKHVDNLRGNVLRLSAAFGLATVTLGYFIKEAAKLEQTRIAFQVMTNSIEVGDRLLKDLYKFARTTPFQIPGVLQATRTLLSMGVASGHMVHTLTQIGEVSAGLNVRLSVLANIFGKVRSVGHLTGFEMERMRRAGVPLSEFLAKTLGTDIPGMLTMIRKKQISFLQFEEAWAAMVEDRFNGLMDKLLGTLLGMLSNVKDFVFEIVTYSGEALLPAMKLWTKQIADVLENSKDLIELNLKIFFLDLSKVIVGLNKHFMRFVSSSKESIYYFGGMKKALTALGIVLSIYFGGTTLKMLAWIFKSTVSFLSIGNIKLMLFAGSMLVILGVLGDIFETLTTNKQTITRDFLDMLEKDYPKAFEKTIRWIRFLKKEIEGMSLMLLGIITMDKDMISAGAYQVLEAYKMAKDKTVQKDSATRGKSVEGGVGGALGVFKRGMGQGSIHGRSEEDVRALYPKTTAISDFMWRLKDFVDYTFQPGGKPETIDPFPSMKERKRGEPLIGFKMHTTEEAFQKLIEGIPATIEMYKKSQKGLWSMARPNVLDAGKYGKGLRSVNNKFSTVINVEKLPFDASMESLTNSIDKSIEKSFKKFSDEEKRSTYNNISSDEILGAKE